MQSLASAPRASALRGQRAARSGRSAPSVTLCTAQKPSASESQSKSALSSVRSILAAGLVTAGAVAAVSLMPLEAMAVSGGGGIGTPISNMDFSGKDLRKNSYTKAVMRGTNFAGSNLVGVSFFGGLAINANFHGANMTNADLENGSFEGADFSDAILAGAYVNNAQFKDNNLNGSDWSEVILRKDTRKYLCTLAEGVNPVTGVDTRESLECP